MAGFKLSDIAANLGLNISTVSRALGGDMRVREETRERVREEARRLGYRPNVAARALAMGRSGVIWFIIPGLENPVEREPALHAGRYLFKRGYDLHIVQHHDDLAVYSRVMDRLAGGAADAAIVIPPGEADGSDEEEVLHSGVPLTYLDRDLSSVPIPTVSTNNEGAASALLTELFSGYAPSPQGSVLVIDCFDTEKNGVEAARARGLRSAGDALIRKGRETGPSFLTYGEDLPIELGAFRSIVIAASSQEMVNRCRSGLDTRLKNASGGAPDFFALTFDFWQGGVDDFARILHVVQDFQSMAERASDLVLDSLKQKRPAASDSENPTRTTILIPFLRIVSIDKP